MTIRIKKGGLFNAHEKKPAGCCPDAGSSGIRRTCHRNPGRGCGNQIHRIPDELGHRHHQRRRLRFRSDYRRKQHLRPDGRGRRIPVQSNHQGMGTADGVLYGCRPGLSQRGRDGAGSQRRQYHLCPVRLRILQRRPDGSVPLQGRGQDLGFYGCHKSDPGTRQRLRQTVRRVHCGGSG